MIETGALTLPDASVVRAVSVTVSPVTSVFGTLSVKVAEVFAVWTAGVLVSEKLKAPVAVSWMLAMARSSCASTMTSTVAPGTIVLVPLAVRSVSVGAWRSATGTIRRAASPRLPAASIA